MSIFRCLDSSAEVEKEDDLHYMEATDGYIVPLQKAYVYASKTLLELLVGEKDLIGHLRSVRHYFLMDQVQIFVCVFKDRPYLFTAILRFVLIYTFLICVIVVF